MSRTRIVGTSSEDLSLGSRTRMKNLVLTLGGTLTMGDAGPPALYLDTNGAGRTVKLPPNPRDGETYFIVNTATAANSITVQDSGGNALSPALAIAQSKSALVQWNATLAVWRFLLSA